MNDLNTRLLAAHETGDHRALVTLYAKAADATDDLDTACFFLTHAYIFALEQGHPDTQSLQTRLKRHGRV